MIGIFDSGSGGLSVMKAVRDEFPESDIVYFGDIKNAPYGSKKLSELSGFTIKAIKLLQMRKADHIISACNSISTTIAFSLTETSLTKPTSFIEMVEPTVSYCKNSSERLALCATPVTIQSGIYQHAFKQIGGDLTTIPIQKLAGAIEFGASDSEIRDIIKSAVVPTMKNFDTLILGCTHYPLVENLFHEVLDNKITILNPANVVASSAKRKFLIDEGRSKTHFILSKESEIFIKYVESLFPGMTYTIEVLQ